MARTPLMAGNWKMNLDHLEANHLVQGLAMALSDAGHDYSKCEVLVIPPFTDIRTVQTIVDADDLGIKYGAQDVSIHDNGAYTGEISTEMLTKLGVSYVGMGHSEPVLRRGPRGPQGRHLRRVRARPDPRRPRRLEGRRGR